MSVKIPVEISARHIHLCQKDLAALFGAGHVLTEKKALTQPGEFAAEETVAVRFGDKEIANVRVISPLRAKTQLEISLTDAYSLGMKALLRSSGDLKGTPGVTLVGPAGETVLDQGAIVALRHLHISPKESKKLGIQNKKTVSVAIRGERALIFRNIKVRIGENYKLSVHLDTDEGNAAGIVGKTLGELIP